MRFNGEAYDKLYPREQDDAEQIETAVEGFTPTATENSEKAVENSEKAVETAEGGENADGSDSADASE